MTQYNKLLNLLTALTNNDKEAASIAISEVLSEKSKYILSERYTEDSDTDTLLVPESATVKVGPYTINIRYKDAIVYALGKQLYPATMTDPAEYEDDVEIGFGQHDGGMPVQIKSVTNQSGQPVEIPPELAKFEVFFDDDDDMASAELAMDDLQINPNDTSEFGQFVIKNKEAVVRSLIGAINSKRAQLRKDFPVQKAGPDYESVNEIDYKKYINTAIDDIAYDANHTGFKNALTQPKYNISDENGTAREQKRRAGISRAIKLMMANRQRSTSQD